MFLRARGETSMNEARVGRFVDISPEITRAWAVCPVFAERPAPRFVKAFRVGAAWRTALTRWLRRSRRTSDGSKIMDFRSTFPMSLRSSSRWASPLMAWRASLETTCRMCIDSSRRGTLVGQALFPSTRESSSLGHAQTRALNGNCSKPLPLNPYP